MSNTSLLKEWFKIPLLSEREEKELVEEYWQTKDRKVRDKLVYHNLRLVISVAKSYHVRYGSFYDLAQEGCLGLIKAVEKFDPNKNVKLNTYAVYWIKAFILRFVVNNAHLVKVGTTQEQRKLFFNLSRLRSRLERQGMVIDNALLARELNVDIGSVIEMEMRLAAPIIHIETLERGTDKKVASKKSPHQFVENYNIPSKLTEDKELHTKIGELSNIFSQKLNKKYKAVFERRFIKDEPDTFESIGKDVGITRQRAQQIEVELKNKFSIFLQKNKLIIVE